MQSMKSALVNGAGQCDAATLNATLVTGNWLDGESYVSDVLPAHCEAYYNHQYISLQAPRYVGTPSNGGHWVEARDYQEASRAYSAQQLSQ